MAQRTSELVARDLGPVRRLAMSSEGRLWSASEGIGLAAWPPVAGGSSSPAGRSAPGILLWSALPSVC